MLGSSEVSAFLARLDVLYKHGDFTTVIHECDKLLRTAASPSAAVICYRARAYRSQGKLAQALSDATEAVRIDRTYAMAHRTLGDIYTISGNIRAAIECCDEALRLDPTLAEAYNTRAGARLIANQLQEALADSQQAIRLDPTLWTAYLTRANARYHLGDAAADEDYVTSYQMNPAMYVKTVVKVINHQVRQDKNGLLANCAMHLRNNPGDVCSLIRRGIAFLLLGREDEAKGDFDRYLQIKPTGQDRLQQMVDEALRLRGSVPALHSFGESSTGQG